MSNYEQFSEQEVRDIYYSIGLANEDRTFLRPILKLLDVVKQKDYSTLGEKIEAFLSMFAKEFPKEASHLSETRSMLEICIRDLGIERKDLTTRFVYSKNDENSENPYLIFHINSEELRDKIIFLNIEEMRFEKIDVKEFDEHYRLHVLDKTTPFWRRYLPKSLEESEVQNEQEDERNDS